MKGNHDYWWTTRAKMESFLEENGLDSLSILHNNAVSVEGLSLCGSRGWMFEQGQEHDKKIINREAGRIRASLQDAQSIRDGGQSTKGQEFHPFSPLESGEGLGIGKEGT